MKKRFRRSEEALGGLLFSLSLFLPLLDHSTFESNLQSTFDNKSFQSNQTSKATNEFETQFKAEIYQLIEQEVGAELGFYKGQKREIPPPFKRNNLRKENTEQQSSELIPHISSNTQGTNPPPSRPTSPTVQDP